MAAALLTKQSALLISAPLVLYLLLFERPRAFSFLASYAIPSIGADLALNAGSGGWYHWYVYAAPSGHTYIWQAFYAFWAWSLFRAFPIAFLAALWFLFTWRTRERLQGNRVVLFYGLFMLGMVGSSWLHRVHRGGFENVLLLAYAAIALLAGIGIALLLQRTSDRARETTLVHVAIIIQLLALTYDPFNYIPSNDQRRAWETGVTRLIREADGPVWLPAHGYLAELGGKSTGAHIEAMYGSVEHAADPTVTEPMRQRIVAALDSQRFAMIIVDQSTPAFARDVGFHWLLDALERNYAVTDTIGLGDDQLMPFTGARTRPQYVLRPEGSGPR